MVRSVSSATLVAVVLGALQLVVAAPVAAAGGRTDTASTTYTLDPEAARLDVQIDVTVENSSSPDINFTVVWLEDTAVAVKVVADRGSATMSFLASAYGFAQYQLFFSPINAGQARHLVITYHVPGGAPRSDSLTRLGQAFVSFCVVSNGIDEGTARLVVPSGYELEVDAHNGEFEASTRAGVTTYQTPTLEEPFNFWACAFGDNPDAYVTTSLESPTGRTIELQAWPEDPTWQDQMEEQIAGALGSLEELVGQELPGDGPIIVREVSSVELGPYAGTFDPDEGVARVSEHLELGTVAHELSHAWFNDSLFAARWLSEGSAAWAESTVTDVPCDEPGDYPGSGQPKLSNWRFAGPRASGEELAVVGYEYGAACYIVASVVERMGPDRMRDVLAALLDDELAYQSGDQALRGRGGAQDWREWLDAVDELGLVPAGVTDLDFAQDLVAEFGAGSETTTALLPARSRARALYHDLVASVGDWSVPEAVLRPMAEWSFTFATVAIDFEIGAYEAATATSLALPEVDAVNGPLKDLVEGARSQAELDAAVVAATEQQAAAEAISAARTGLAEPLEPLEEIGLYGTDLQPTLAEGIAAVEVLDGPKAMAAAALIDSTLAGASQQGVLRVAIALAVVLVALLAVGFLAWSSRRRRASPGPGLEVPAGPDGLPGLVDEGVDGHYEDEPAVEGDDPAEDRGPEEPGDHGHRTADAPGDEHLDRATGPERGAGVSAHLR